MADILHRVVIETDADSLYRALTTSEGLSSWWTKCDTTPEVGNTATFYFGEKCDHIVDMEITGLTPGKQVKWKCLEGPWAGTEDFTFDIVPDERGVALEFANHGWPEADKFFMHCNCKWGLFFGNSLKNYLETGTGQPHPMDPRI